MSDITSTSEIAEQDWGSDEEPGEVRTDMVATEEAINRGIEFHVSMRDYTLRDMEELIIEAAAKQLVGRHNDRELAKVIEAKCIEQVTAKADAALAKVTSQIIDQPLTPKFGDKTPTTMREFLGLFGREYLTERVGYDGKPTEAYRTTTFSRMEWIVGQLVSKKFQEELEKETNSMKREIEAQVRAQHAAFLAEQKKKFEKAFAKAVSGA